MVLHDETHGGKASPSFFLLHSLFFSTLSLRHSATLSLDLTHLGDAVVGKVEDSVAQRQDEDGLPDVLVRLDVLAQRHEARERPRERLREEVEAHVVGAAGAAAGAAFAFDPPCDCSAAASAACAAWNAPRW